MSFKDQREFKHIQSDPRKLRDAVRASNQAGLALLAKKEPSKALEKFLEVLKEDPDHLYVASDVISYQCAQAHYALKEYETALEDINQAVRTLPREAAYWAFKATVLDAQVKTAKQRPVEKIGESALMAILCYEAALLCQPGPSKTVVKSRQALIQWTDKQFKMVKSSVAQYLVGHLKSTTRTLNLYDYTWDAQSMATLCQTLTSHTHLTTLYLDYTQLNEGQLASVARALSDNLSLTTIVWQGFVPGKKNDEKIQHKQKIDALLHRNRLQQKKQLDADDLRQLDFAALKPQDRQTVLKQHATTLTALNFEGLDCLNQNASLVPLITTPMQYPQLTALTLRRTQLRDEHVQQFYAGLTKNSDVLFPALVTLDVRDNCIANIGFRLLLGLIQSNMLPRLHQLLLQDNHITQELSSDFEEAKTTLKEGTCVSLYLSGNFLKPVIRPSTTRGPSQQSHTQEKESEAPFKEIEMAPLERTTPSSTLLTEKERHMDFYPIEKKYRPELTEETGHASEREISTEDESTTSVSESKTMTASLLLDGLQDLSPTEQLDKIAAYQASLLEQLLASLKSPVSVYPQIETPLITRPSSVPKPALFEFEPDEMAPETLKLPDTKTRTEVDTPSVFIAEEKPSATPAYMLIPKAQRSGLGHFTAPSVCFFRFKSSPSPKTSIIDPRKEITPTDWVVRLARTTGWNQSAFLLFEGMDELGQRFLRRAFLGKAENGRAPVHLEKNLDKTLSGLNHWYLSEKYAYVIKSLLVVDLIDYLNTQAQQGTPYTWYGGCAPCAEETQTEKNKRPLNCMLWCRSLLDRVKAKPLPSSLARAPCCAMPPGCE